jgi:ribonucleoside-diphosphate reductase alpha chain
MVDLYTEGHHNGEVGLCSLAGIVYTRIEEDDDEQYFKSCKYALKMIDYCIHNSTYELPHIGYTAKQRMNAAVGLLDVANHMAKKYLPYNSKAGMIELHKIAERHSYFMIKAALELGNSYDP